LLDFKISFRFIPQDSLEFGDSYLGHLSSHRLVIGL
jgi:hypothetical protein